MSAALSRTPLTVPIEPRHPAFDLAGCLACDWHGGDPFRTAFFNALSLTFPRGERFFIDSVRAFEPQIRDAKLAQEIRGFIGQEAIHSREHHRLNEALCAARRYDPTPIYAWIDREIAWANNHLDALTRLAATVATEHLTAIFGNALLTNPAWLEGADPRMAALWRWHAVEEIEHKSVAFDTYIAAGGDRRLLRTVLRIETWQLFRQVFAGMRMMLRTGRVHRKPTVWWTGLKWLFGREGILRKVAPQWREFMREDFHPWAVDNSPLILRWQQESGASAPRTPVPFLRSQSDALDA
jgi:predicted metal-dependent hydrolase